MLEIGRKTVIVKAILNGCMRIYIMKNCMGNH